MADTTFAADTSEIRRRSSNRAVNTGLFSNVLLAAVKTAGGILGNSTALLADGINSTSDVAYYILVKIFTSLASKPADPEHPYGHMQMESIAALTVGAFVVTTAIAIFWDSVNTAFNLVVGTNEPESPVKIYTLYIALITILVKIWLSVYTRRVAQRTSNAAILALAHDHRNDLFASMAAVIGISLNMAGYTWVDPLAGAVVAVVIATTGISILRESSAELMDTVPGEALNRQIRKIVMSVSGVDEVQEIGAHRFGPYFMINLTIGIKGDLSVAQGDQIATEVERALIEELDLVQRVYVHYHPAGQG